MSRMHKTAVDFAIKYHLRLGRFSNRFYFLRSDFGEIFTASCEVTAISAIAMMRKELMLNRRSLNN